ncbi:MAG: sodium:solute symporter family protein [Vicinamibacterales bacterium]|jgi:Na+/proline symporter|nr:sodium:solute symporter [Acidobacteriota bacterium]MDP6371266.1 sodium:solute symporter family protein [Vicinamibacterales bacterium]MDP6609154.1 sodium:solute symporter family protein [Vicinamibacterales bacterium]
MTTLLALALIIYVAVMFAIGLWARGRIHDTEDYLVAGRRLGLWLAAPTLFATWFGAGTLLTATDEIRADGLVKAALDPFGAGLCLLLAGWFYAKPLWRMRLLTLPDYFGRRFGPRAEIVCSAIMVPGYFGWIAAQFVALAGILELFFGIPLGSAIALVAFVGMSYTLVGGMWSVTMTDCVQTGLLVLGLVLVAWNVLTTLGAGSAGAGWSRLLDETPPEMLDAVPTESMALFVGWLGVLAAGSLGNIPGQDLTQRFFAARSAGVAARACWVAGVAYLVIGSLPPLIGLAANLVAPDAGARSIIPLIAQLVLDPWLTLIFVLAVTSAVLSTIDSGILAPSSVLAQNLLPRLPGRRFSPLALNRAAVVGVTGGSLLLAYVGDDAYELLESAYEVGLVALVVPLTMGLHARRGGERAALASMLVATAVWLPHLALGWESFLGPVTVAWSVPPPTGLTCAGIGLVAYLAADRGEGPADADAGMTQRSGH